MREADSAEVLQKGRKKNRTHYLQPWRETQAKQRQQVWMPAQLPKHLIWRSPEEPDVAAHS